MPQWKQKSVGCILDLVARFSDAGDPAEYLCAMNMAVAKAILLFPEH